MSVNNSYAVLLILVSLLCWLVKPPLPENSCFLALSEEKEQTVMFPTWPSLFFSIVGFVFEKEPEANDFLSFPASHFSSFYSLNFVMLIFYIFTLLGFL